MIVPTQHSLRASQPVASTSCTCAARSKRAPYRAHSAAATRCAPARTAIASVCPPTAAARMTALESSHAASRQGSSSTSAYPSSERPACVSSQRAWCGGIGAMANVPPDGVHVPPPAGVRAARLPLLGLTFPLASSSAGDDAVGGGSGVLAGAPFSSARTSAVRSVPDANDRGLTRRPRPGSVAGNTKHAGSAAVRGSSSAAASSWPARAASAAAQPNDCANGVDMALSSPAVTARWPRKTRSTSARPCSPASAIASSRTLTWGTAPAASSAGCHVGAAGRVVSATAASSAGAAATAVPCCSVASR